jgi:hypothetical protein
MQCTAQLVDWLAIEVQSLHVQAQNCRFSPANMYFGARISAINVFYLVYYEEKFEQKIYVHYILSQPNIYGIIAHTLMLT